MEKTTLCYKLDEKQEYEQDHGHIVDAYLRAGRPEEFEMCSNKYKSIDKGEITTIYNESGDTLFDVENARLSVEAAKIEEQPDSEEKADKSEDADKKQDNKAEDVKVYTSGEEKLMAEENEMLSSVKPEFKKVMQAQLDLIFKELIGWTKQDPEFEKKVLLTHKSMKRCMKFCSDKAMGLREPSDQEKAAARNNNIPIMTPVGSDMLFEWIKEYYDKDDKADVEKEKKAAAAQKKSADKKKAAEKKKEAPKESASKKQDKKTSEKKEDTKVTASPKKQDKFVNGQISMFDLLGV